jgi:hypothetical protein
VRRPAHSMAEAVLGHSVNVAITGTSTISLDGKLAAFAHGVVNLGMIFNEARWRALCERNLVRVEILR